MANSQLGGFSLGFSQTAISKAQSSISRDRFALAVFLIAVISTLVQSSLILVSLGKLPPQVPIFYSRPWGAMMLSAPAALWILPAICILATLLNWGLSVFIAVNNKFLTRILFSFTLIVATLTLYDMGKIISLLI